MICWQGSEQQNAFNKDSVRTGQSGEPSTMDRLREELAALAQEVGHGEGSAKTSSEEKEGNAKKMRQFQEAAKERFRKEEALFDKQQQARQAAEKAVAEKLRQAEEAAKELLEEEEAAAEKVQQAEAKAAKKRGKKAAR